MTHRSHAQVLQEGEGTGRRGHRVLRVEPQKASELQWWWACEDATRLPCHHARSGPTLAQISRRSRTDLAQISHRSVPTLGPRGVVRLSRTVWLVCVCVVQRHGSAVDCP